jgi:hypothetical protein
MEKLQQLILVCHLSAPAGKHGKYALSLQYAHKTRSTGTQSPDCGHDIGPSRLTRHVEILNTLLQGKDGHTAVKIYFLFDILG